MKDITFTTHRLSAAMPLILGLAAIAAAPTVGAAVIEQVDIINGCVDVTENGSCTSFDDATNLLMTCNDATAIQVDIINGGVDVTEGGGIGGTDDARDCDLNDLVGAFPSTPATNSVHIINGEVDVNRSGVVNSLDDASNVRFIKLP